MKKISIMSTKAKLPKLESASESPDERTKDSNWQAAKSNLRQRNAVMLNNHFAADVQFIVGSPGNTQRIPAHKYILITGSSVFYTMFYGALAEHREIEIPDIEPGAFLALLEYLYCDKIPTEVGTAFELLYPAKKYDISHLEQVCVHHLKTNLSVTNVWIILSQSRFYEHQRLTQHCWQIIDAQTKTALSSDNFVDIEVDTLKSLLEREFLNCREIHLWDASVRWASAECVRREVEVTPAHQRECLEPVLNLIRFPVMTMTQFADGPAQAKILCTKETSDILLHFTATHKPKLRFPITCRKKPVIEVCRRFKCVESRFGRWNMMYNVMDSGISDAIQFSVNKRIFIYGFGLHSAFINKYSCNFKIQLGEFQASRKYSPNSNYNAVPVAFENPIQIEPNVVYTASSTIDGGVPDCFGTQGFSEVTVSGVKFKFQDSPASALRTNVKQGQIPEIRFLLPIL